MKEMIRVNKELIPLVDDEGNSALHLACIEGYNNVAKVLIDGGATVDARYIDCVDCNHVSLTMCSHNYLLSSMHKI